MGGEKKKRVSGGKGEGNEVHQGSIHARRELGFSTFNRCKEGAKGKREKGDGEGRVVRIGTCYEE